MSPDAESELSERPATYANWLEHPANRWSFRHVRELFPTARVAATNPAPLPVDQEAQPLTADDRAHLTRTHTDALVALRRGRVAIEWYAPGVGVHDRHILFSVTKSVTGLVVGALIGQGKLNADDRVDAIVPQARAGGFGDATVRNLLDMTAAVRFAEDYDGPDMRAYRAAAGLMPERSEIGLHAFIAQLPGDGGHGRRYRYTSPSSDMLGWICERASGRRWSELVSEHIWGPMGATADGDLLIDHLGAPRTGGGLCATARDMARIGQLLVEQGAGSVPASFVRDLIDGGDHELWAAGEIAHLFPAGAYRNCWYRPGERPGVVMAVGIYGQWIYVDVQQRIVVVKQSSGRTATDPDTDGATIAGLAELAARLAA